MTTFVRICAGLGLSAALFSVMQFLAPEWLASIGCDPSEITRLEEKIALLQAAQERLATTNVGLEERIDAKSHIARTVLDGEMSLFEAAARFQELARKGPPTSHLHILPGSSDEERYCRQVISFVGAEADTRSTSEAIDAVDRLEQQLEDHICERGKVQLPNYREAR